MFDLRRAGYPEPKPVPPFVITVEGEAITAITLGVSPEDQELDIAA